MVIMWIILISNQNSMFVALLDRFLFKFCTVLSLYFLFTIRTFLLCFRLLMSPSTPRE